MRTITIFFIVLIAAGRVMAQGVASGGASQSANLQLSDAIDISFINSNTVNMQFNTVNDYANGVESAEQAILIRTNKKFNVRVKALSSRFAYSGTASTDPRMSVNPILKLKVVSNQTGGSVSSGYTSYKVPPTSNGTRIIQNGRPGAENTFTVKYMANPGFNYPAGTYSVDIMYTATQA